MVQTISAERALQKLLCPNCDSLGAHWIVRDVSDEYYAELHCIDCGKLLAYISAPAVDRSS